MTYDRSKFRGSSMNTMQKARKTAEETSFTQKKGEWNFLEIKPGRNIFRIFPSHDPENDAPFQPERKTFLKVEMPKKTESGDIIPGKFEIKNKPIFIATVHGLTKAGKPIKKDVIERYIEYVYARANDEIQDKKERESFLGPITGFMVGKKFTPGIRPSTNLIYYAMSTDAAIGRLTLYPSDTQEMERLSLKANEEEDDADSIDIFSDPDGGINLEIDYDPNGEKGKKRKVSAASYNPKKFSNYEDFILSMQISDEKLKEFSEMKSLKDLYVDVYTTKDFDYALEGLSRFDEENEYVIFENDEFLAEAEAMRAELKEPAGKDEPEEEEEETPEPPKRQAATVRRTPTPEQPKRTTKPAPKPEPEYEEEEEETPEPPKRIVKPAAKVEPKPEVVSPAKTSMASDVAARIAALRNNAKKG